MRQYPLERLIKNIGTNNKTVAALLQPRFCAYKKAVIAVRVSGGHLCKAEAPTEPAGETAARRAAILRPCHCEHRKVRGNPFFSFEESTDSFALYHSCGAQKLFSLGVRTTFDRGASFCSLLPAPQALATSLRMTIPFSHCKRRKVCGIPPPLSLRCGCPVGTSAKQKHRPSRQARPL